MAKDNRPMPTAKQIFNYTENENGCWVHNNQPGQSGHVQLGARRDGVYYCWQAHRASYISTNGPIANPSLVVRHLCIEPKCVNPKHLSLGTVQDNVDDRMRAGNQALGTNHGRATLTEAQVIEIFHASGTNKQLGEIYGVSLQTIWGIRNKRTWTHLTNHE